MTAKARVLVFLAVSLVAGNFLFSQTQESADLFDKYKEGVVALYAYGDNKELVAKGVAFGLAQDVVATSYHLVSRAAEVEVVNIKGKKMKLDGVIAADRALDVALLKLKGKITAIPLGRSEGLESGARLFGLGANESGDITITEGTVMAIHRLSANESVIASTMSLPEGFSGGPLLNLNGQAIALIVVLERSRVGIPIDAWRSLPTAGRITSFKDWSKEDYLATFEGAYLAGRIFSLTDENASAQRYLEKAVQLKPDMVEAQALLADVYANQRNFDAAVGAFQKVIGLDPNRTSAHLGLGGIFIRTQRWNDAAGALEKAIALDGTQKEAVFQLGTAYEELRDFAKAADAYDRFLKMQPENAWMGYLRLGSCRMELQQYELAIVALQEAQKAQPRDIKVNYSLAQAYRMAQQYDKAQTVLQGLAELNPVDASTYYSDIVKMYDEAGQNENAIAAARKVIELNPDSEIAVYNLAIMFQKLQRYEEAIAAFQQALTIKPDYDVAHYNIGSCYLNLKMFRQSIEAFKNYVALVPDNADAWLQIGVCYMQLKDFDSALDPLKKSVELRPDYGVALFNLAVVYLNLKDNYSAREIYRTLVTVDPDLAERLKKYLR
ncbi:MAG: tetratricopeptide repeat protein [Candidatus Aminicenantales bacterium]